MIIDNHNHLASLNLHITTMGGLIMSKGNIRHMFPGGNTSQGFFSYYNYILEQSEATRIFVIKGGPGVGKSTFMKQIGNELAEQGYDVEFMHCSSDNNSLDGVVIPGIKVALLDGTAPHVVDPINPGAVDEIIHLGDFWDEKGMRKNKEAIMRENQKVGRLFSRAYKYLKAAACLYEDMKEIYKVALNRPMINVVTHNILKELFGDSGISVKEGRERKLFASAITPAGLKNYLDTILITEKIYLLESCPGISTDKLLNSVKNAAQERGYYVECYYCALFPRVLEHIVIPELNVSFTTANKYHNAEVKAYRRINFKEFISYDTIKSDRVCLEYNQCEFEELLDKAIETINMAKATHDKMEEYYIPNMDFAAVQKCREETMRRILEYAKNIESCA